MGYRFAVFFYIQFRPGHWRAQKADNQLIMIRVREYYQLTTRLFYADMLCDNDQSSWQWHYTESVDGVFNGLTDHLSNILSQFSPSTTFASPLSPLPLLSRLLTVFEFIFPGQEQFFIAACMQVEGFLYIRYPFYVLRLQVLSLLKKSDYSPVDPPKNPRRTTIVFYTLCLLYVLSSLRSIYCYLYL